MYNKYITYLNNITRKKKLDVFKRSPYYTPILEHLTFLQGQLYLDEIIKHDIPVDHIIQFCKKNDAQGSPKMYQYEVSGTKFHASPTSLRYVYHAYQILNHMNTLDQYDFDIIEIGGGYGGLLLAISFFKPLYLDKKIISSYNIIDLKPPLRLQELYLAKFKDICFSYSFHDASLFGKDLVLEKNLAKNFFLIANYSFSEISLDLQKQYTEILFPHIQHGFILWNSAAPVDLPFSYTDIEEKPQTCGAGWKNKLVTF